MNVDFITMLLQPTFARVPLSSIVPVQRALPTVRLVANVRAGKSG